ncbi:hypothetical protein B296_00056839, partial [Ensete ventricosum]
VAEFSGLRSSTCVTFATNARDASFSDVLAAQLSTKTAGAVLVKGETIAKLKVAINGFGRIGRNFLRCWHSRNDSPLEVVVVNDSGGVKNGTGVFVDGPGAGKHIQAGAKKVIITAPAKGADIPTYVVGVNEGDYTHEVSNIVRAAALNIVPTSTGAAKAVSLVLPQLKGKLNGIALRVPTPNVSVVDLVVNVEKKGMRAEDVNNAFRKAADGPLKGILAVCDVPLVSVDFRCSDVSSTIDSSLTMVMGDDMIKVVAWYDNEWGYR